MFCPNCGKELGPQSIFCPGCGKRVPEDPMKQAPSATSKQPAPYPGAGTPGQPPTAAPTYAPKPPTYGGYSAQTTGAPTYPGSYQAGQQAGRYNPLGVPLPTYPAAEPGPTQPGRYEPTYAPGAQPAAGGAETIWNTKQPMAYFRALDWVLILAAILQGIGLFFMVITFFVGAEEMTVSELPIYYTIMAAVTMGVGMGFFGLIKARIHLPRGEKKGVAWLYTGAILNLLTVFFFTAVFPSIFTILFALLYMAGGILTMVYVHKRSRLLQ